MNALALVRTAAVALLLASSAALAQQQAPASQPASPSDDAPAGAVANEFPPVVRDDVHAAQRAAGTAILACLDREVSVDARVVVDVTVHTDAKGAVTQVVVGSLLDDVAPLAATHCIDGALRPMVFPAPPPEGKIALGLFSINMDALREARTSASQPGKKRKVTYRGSLSREEIESTLKSVRNQVRFCYEKRLAKHPELKGSVVMNFVIGGSGEVKSAEALADPGMEEVASCATLVVRRLKFPSPRGGGNVIVNYPYRFSPEEKASAKGASGAATDEGLPPPDDTKAKPTEPGYFSQCCGCLP